MAVTIQFGLKLPPANCSVFLHGHEENEYDTIWRVEVNSGRLRELASLCTKYSLHEVCILGCAEGYTKARMEEDIEALPGCYYVDEEIDAEDGDDFAAEYDTKLFDCYLYVSHAGFWWVEVRGKGFDAETTCMSVSVIEQAVGKKVA